MVYFFLGALLCDGEHELVVGELNASEDAIVQETLLQDIDVSVVAHDKLVEEGLVIDECKVPGLQQLIAKVVGTGVAELSGFLQPLPTHERAVDDDEECHEALVRADVVGGLLSAYVLRLYFLFLLV